MWYCSPGDWFDISAAWSVINENIFILYKVFFFFLNNHILFSYLKID